LTPTCAGGWTPTQFRSRSRNTPFEGWALTGKARYTFVGGALVHRGD
jgi:dihydroorotase-like cyclic amidohydrolase